jgi:hypothetical protein
MTSHPGRAGRRQRLALPRRNFILIYVFETPVEENHSSTAFCSMVSLADVIISGGFALFSLYALIGTFSESRASNVADEP